ncbi:phosphoglycerate mutase family protein [Longimicrobium terrae]|uniref:Broad specificity phosphatase PhoE n=1 Tax=Longimicrobium terrae TaxID=1639882 RepID=A0A841H3K8_9BACT|nr:phosphoglycerate mutase family protein [Longimicrobium terrae]MBB4638342.1 broad specificity phosphatase PhoE [Longimicrobium terrae]MBB6072590.1 broad specificity phosphatase PhoE [Longimicrobium terrae]NNC28631.1 histidine phosphatase family protein [Longimicrobium terrae]
MIRTLRVALFAALVAAVPAAAQDSTVVVIVRHAEKAVIQGESNPPLSEAGQARARALADSLASWNVDAVVTTQYVRTQQTAAPLMAARGLTPVVVSTAAEGGAENHPAQVAAAVRALAAKTVLVVGHSNTVTQIMQALGGPAARDLCDGEYSNLYVMVLKPGQAPRVQPRRYGQPDAPTEADCRRTM